MKRQEEQQLLCRAATTHAHPKDTHALEQLFASGGWLTLLTIAESSTPASRSNGHGNTGTSSNGLNSARAETPLAAFEGMGIDSPRPGEGGAGGGGGGEKTCPHCTFVNDAGRGDCEICGLPLDG
jgi:nuclear protein localization family protein 4